MRCLDASQIARALTLGIDDPHFRDCLDCRRRLEADRSTRDALRVLPVPALTGAHRKALAAEVIATAERLPIRRRRSRVIAAASGALAMAAAISIVTWWPHSSESPILVSPSVESVETVGIGTSSVASEDSPPAIAAPVIAAPLIEATRGTTFRHATGGDRDVITLVDGALELDTRFARKIDVRVGDSIVHVENASVKIEARTRSIVSVRVIVGAARIDSPVQHVTLQRDSEWIPAPGSSAPAGSTGSSASSSGSAASGSSASGSLASGSSASGSSGSSASAKARSLAAFRDAWIALRAGDNREAVALFDSVTDAVALEEASYWAIIAARRANDASVPARIAKFLRAFPQSEYAAELRAAQ